MGQKRLLLCAVVLAVTRASALPAGNVEVQISAGAEAEGGGTSTSSLDQSGGLSAAAATQLTAPLKDEDNVNQKSVGINLTPPIRVGGNASVSNSGDRNLTDQGRCGFRGGFGGGFVQRPVVIPVGVNGGLTPALGGGSGIDINFRQGGGGRPSANLRPAYNSNFQMYPMYYLRG